ncbi:Polysaccharide biosynthesis protein [Micromonospora nigra]|uniref:Polysaccharide biosynthesis protein n=1 Tax=Micromonospora nigra TaxID=145857 RepID=A0A1C6RW65_9ACTN|nr:polysaccharide biosynthesis protein [Micromonospora nigra]SCL21481.1 Polysaccharide biosynthesis protein [Micromonospora nigra]
MTQTTGGATTAVRLGAAGAAVTAATVLINALAYAVPVLGARRLTPADLGALATVLALATIAAVPGFGLQIAVAAHRARRGVSDPTRLALRTAAVTAGLTALAAPVLSWALTLPLALTLLLAASTFATVLAGRRIGELQGDQRFLRLAAAMAVVAAGRYGGLVVGLAFGRSPVDCLALGTVTGFLVLPILARLAQPTEPVHTGPPGAGPADPLGPRQVLTACAASLAMLTISYADLILARQLLSADASGGYAVGSVLTKGALWAPQVVTLLVLPRLARGDRQARAWALGLILSCGAVLVGASVVAGDLAFRLAGGAAYLHLAGEAPLFAAVGALYAVVFMLVNDRVATGARWPGAPLWAATGALGLTALLVAPRTVSGVLACALGTAVLTAVVMALLTLRPARR